MVKCSILIPTYNRLEKLKVVLNALAQQKGIEDAEVIIGIDGSTDRTEDYLEEHSKNYPFRVTFFWIENSGRSVIRNQLIERSQGELLIFIQDDIVVCEGWLAGHLEAQDQESAAVIGHVTWYPEQKISPYMHWLENGGHMLDFRSLKDGVETDFWHFYMGNLSVPRSLVAELRFDETLPCYGWEDILFGFHFVKKGNKVYYRASACAFHWDEYLEEDLQEYMKKVGRSAVAVEKKYPGIGFVPAFWKRCVFSLMILLAWPLRPVLPQKWRWYVEMKKGFLEAVSDERRKVDT